MVECIAVDVTVQDSLVMIMRTSHQVLLVCSLILLWKDNEEYKEVNKNGEHFKMIKSKKFEIDIKFSSNLGSSYKNACTSVFKMCHFSY